MKYDAHKLPIRSSSAGDQIETRPLYIEEWLDSLPYVDIKKTSQLLFEATRATNEQKSLKSTIRLQLVELYNRPYKYYIDSQIRAGAQHTLQSIETMQQQIEVLKKIAINLGKACKIAADESMKKKTLWKQTKPPLHSLHLSFNYLSHALIFSYLEYSPTPKGVWQELNFIYDFAESLGQENTTLSIPKGSEKRILATIALAYKRIVLASLADPYHLPFGAIWEIYEQLFTWAELSTIGKFSTPSEPASHFIMNLNSDTSPIPYSKFNAAKAKEKHRLLDASKITNLVQTNLSMINKGTSLDDTVILSPYFAKLILGHMSRSWGLPAKRLNQRKEKEGMVSMTCWLNAVYYFINHEKEFVLPITESQDEIIAGETEIQCPVSDTLQTSYMPEKWGLVDQSSQGFAVIKDIKPAYSVRVGDLIAISIRKKGEKKSTQWILGVIRWLMIRDGKVFKVGVRTLTTQANPVAVRSCSGSAIDTQYRRGILISDPKSPEKTSLVTSQGLYIQGRELEIVDDNTRTRILAENIIESTTGFELFAINQK